MKLGKLLDETRIDAEYVELAVWNETKEDYDDGIGFCCGCDDLELVISKTAESKKYLDYEINYIESYLHNGKAILRIEVKHKNADRIGKPEAIYTGGGIWICGMYIDENIYCTIDNDCNDECLTFFDHRDEDNAYDDCDPFPCQNMIDSREYKLLTKEEKKIFRVLKKELEKEAF